jgi:DNA-binding PadR family transcriptional regulator
VLELAVLGVLKDQPLHGYQLKKRLAELLGPWSSVSFGSLYPALNRLERAGAVAVQADGAVPPAEPIPMTGSLGGELAAFRARRARPRQARPANTTSSPRRAKKVYRITDRGERLFEEMLAASDQAGDDDRAFHLRLAFARHLAADARLGLLERRRAHLVERLARARASVRGSWERLDSYTRSLAEHRTAVTEHDISWLDQLIAAERKST